MKQLLILTSFIFLLFQLHAQYEKINLSLSSSHYAIQSTQLILSPGVYSESYTLVKEDSAGQLVVDISPTTLTYIADPGILFDTYKVRAKKEGKLEPEHSFNGGIALIGVQHLKNLIDATIKVYLPHTKQLIASAETTNKIRNNPQKIHLFSGQYLFEIIPKDVLIPKPAPITLEIEEGSINKKIIHC